MGLKPVQNQLLNRQENRINADEIIKILGNTPVLKPSKSTGK